MVIFCGFFDKIVDQPFLEIIYENQRSIYFRLLQLLIKNMKSSFEKLKKNQHFRCFSYIAVSLSTKIPLHERTENQQFA